MEICKLAFCAFNIPSSGMRYMYKTKHNGLFVLYISGEATCTSITHHYIIFCTFLHVTVYKILTKTFVQLHDIIIYIYIYYIKVTNNNSCSNFHATLTLLSDAVDDDDDDAVCTTRSKAADDWLLPRRPCEDCQALLHPPVKSCHTACHSNVVGLVALSHMQEDSTWINEVCSSRTMEP